LKIVAVLATTAAADVTGILLASLLAALGFFVIPAKRRQAKSELREKIGELRESLVSTLRAQFEREIERSMQNINEHRTLRRYVRCKHDKLNERRHHFKAEQDEWNASRCASTNCSLDGLSCGSLPLHKYYPCLIIFLLGWFTLAGCA
jgi:hypothetical protein